jgi:hypothetical protein
MPIYRKQVELLLSCGVAQAVVVLLPGNTPSRMWRMHKKYLELLGGPMDLLDLVVDRTFMLGAHTEAVLLVSPSNA